MQTLILGIPKSGKTTLGKKLAVGYRMIPRSVVVLTATLEKWPADYITDDPADFLEHCRLHTDLRVFVDESGDAFKLKHFNSDLNWLGTRGRHLGHACFYIGQGYPQVPPAVRRCCTSLYLFTTNIDDAETLARAFNAPELIDAPNLKQGEFFYKEPFYHVRRGKINFATGSVEIEKRRKIK